MEYYNMIRNETRVAVADIDKLPGYFIERFSDEVLHNLNFIYDRYHDVTVVINGKLLTNEYVTIVDGVLSATAERQGILFDKAPDTMKNTVKTIIDISRKRKKIIEQMPNGLWTIDSFPLKAIKILPEFEKTQPKPVTIAKKLVYFNAGVVPGNIVVNTRNELVDGYATYLLALENGIENIKVSVVFGCEYVVAKHNSSDKQYYFRVPFYLYRQLKPGDKITVHTARGMRKARVVYTFERERPDREEAKKWVIKKGELKTRRNH